MNTPHLMTKAEFSRHIDKSDSYVSRLDKQGRLVKDSAGLVMVAQSLALIEATRDPGRGGDRSAPKSQASSMQAALGAEATAGAHVSAPVGGVISYNEAARREKLAKAQTAELEQAEAAGALVRRERVERVVFGLARMAMEALRNIPYRIAGQLATTTDPTECERIVETELQEVIKAMASASLDDDSADAEAA